MTLFKNYLENEIADIASEQASPFRLSLSVSSGPFAGGSADSVDLIEGTNQISLNLPAFPRDPGSGWDLSIHTPTFSSGTLQLVALEMDIVSSDGLEAIGVQLGDFALSSNEHLNPVWHDANAFTQIGTDLILSSPPITVSTAAGGVYAVAVYLEVLATGLIA